jgi:hypothetical protein
VCIEHIVKCLNTFEYFSYSCFNFVACPPKKGYILTNMANHECQVVNFTLFGWYTSDNIHFVCCMPILCINRVFSLDIVGDIILNRRIYFHFLIYLLVFCCHCFTRCIDFVLEHVWGRGGVCVCVFVCSKLLEPFGHRMFLFGNTRTIKSMVHWNDIAEKFLIG